MQYKIKKVNKILFIFIALFCTIFFGQSKQVLSASVPTFVQAAPIGRVFFAGTSNVSSTFSNNVTNGNLIAVIVWWDNTNSPNLNSISDSCGNSYALVGSRFSSGNYFVQPAYAKNVIGGSKCAVTATLSSAPQLIYLAAHEISGLDTVSPLDTFASSANGYQGSASIALSSGSVTTTAANDYIFGGIFDVGSNGGIMSPGSGFTSRIASFNTDNKSATTEDRIQATAGSVSATFTDSTASNALVTVVAFKAATDNSPPPPAGNVTAPTIPTNLTANAVSSFQINLTWSASTDNGGVTGYKIYRGGVQIATSTTNSYSNTGLSPSTSYNYTISAYDVTGNLSAQSASASATTQAQQSGNTITASSCSQSAVQTAINSAQNGYTVIVPAGNCTWTTNSPYAHSVIINKAIILQGAGIDQTIITDSTGSQFDEDPISIGSGARLTGFTFTKMPYRNSSEPAVKTNGNNWRIDHNKFHPNGTLPQVGRGIVAYGTGLIDHNIFLDTRQGVDIEGSGDSSWVGEAAPLGTSNAIFIEDNTFTNSGDMLDGAYDAYHGARYVFRYNTITGTNIGHHGLDSGGLRSTHSFEIYNNNFNNPGTHIFTAMQFRGGSGVVFNNTINGSGGSYDSFAILRNYRSDSAYTSSWGACDGSNPLDGNTPGGQGYPCRDQIGRTSNQVLSPVYAWNNTFKGSTAPTFDVQAYNNPTRAQQYHIVANRDFYNNTQKPGYASYTYPHPLVSGSTTPPPTTHTITSSVGTGGSITPSGSVSVTNGGSQTFTITPSIGYNVSSIMVDGSNMGAITAYTFSNVTASHTISATFTANQPIPGDFNLDHVVNTLDFSLLNSRWLQNYPPYDLFVDGLINSLDFAIFSSNWGKTW